MDLFGYKKLFAQLASRYINESNFFLFLELKRKKAYVQIFLDNILSLLPYFIGPIKLFFIKRKYILNTLCLYNLLKIFIARHKRHKWTI